jgi:hypothetical protein
LDAGVGRGAGKGEVVEAGAVEVVVAADVYLERVCQFILGVRTYGEHSHQQISAQMEV